MPRGRTLQEFTEDYFTKHPEEIDDFLKESLEEYAKDSDSTALLSQLRVIARVKGITNIAEAESVSLSERDSLRVLDALENPPAPNTKLCAAARALPKLS